jgi:hypothetical protein
VIVRSIELLEFKNHIIYIQKYQGLLVYNISGCSRALVLKAVVVGLSTLNIEPVAVRLDNLARQFFYKMCLRADYKLSTA